VEPPPSGSREGIGVHPPSRTVPDLQLRLQAQPNSAQLLRQRLYLWLDELGARGEEIFDVSLASTEAFANAIEHPHEPKANVIDIDGSFSDGAITIIVRDYGSWRQQRQRDEGGYGFPLMRQLMNTVEVDTRPDGTSIRMQRQLARMPRLH
jgi:anti-sigma regulatory factor (Ser/Thr protein kinase)